MSDNKFAKPDSLYFQTHYVQKRRKSRKSNLIEEYKAYIQLTNFVSKNISGVSYLIDEGTSGINKIIYSGRALSFDSASSQSVDIDLITLNSDFTFCANFVHKNEAYSTLLGKTDGNLYIAISNNNVLYIRGSIFENIPITLNTQLVIGDSYSLAVVRSGSDYLVYIDDALDSTYTFTTLRTLTFDSLGRYGTTYKSSTLSNLVVTNEAITPQQIADYSSTPHTFLYKENGVLTSDSGLDTSKVVTWFPMTENGSSVTDIASGISYPITNYTVDMNQTGLNYGLQASKLLLDTNGVLLGKSNYFELYGTEKFTIPANIRTSNLTIQYNPKELTGSILTGDIILDTTGLTINTDNDISLNNQSITNTLDVGIGCKGTLKIYQEDLA